MREYNLYWRRVEPGKYDAVVGGYPEIRGEGRTSGEAVGEALKLLKEKVGEREHKVKVQKNPFKIAWG